MKRSLIPAAVALLTMLNVEATTPKLTSITQPLYFLGSAGGAEIQYIKTPKILNNASAMFWIELFASPTVPKVAREDLNLISIYGIKIRLGRQDQDGRVKEVIVDIANAKRDQRYPFTILESAQAAIKAVRLEFPKESETTILLKNGDKILERHKGLTSRGTESVAAPVMRRAVASLLNTPPASRYAACTLTFARNHQ